MVTNAGQELAQEDQVKTAYIKKILSSQIDINKPYRHVCFISVNVYHFLKLDILLTQYTSYEVPCIDKVVPKFNEFGSEKS
jgi:hypothetical protein